MLQAYNELGREKQESPTNSPCKMIPYLCYVSNASSLPISLSRLII
jgi:hypothetical protein